MTVPRSLRAQLTLAFTGMASVVVLAAAVSMRVLIGQAVWAPLDAALEEEAETLRAFSEDHPEEMSAAVRRIASETDLGPGKFVRVTTGDGRTIARAGAPPPRKALQAPSQRATGYATVGHGHHAYRIVWYPTSDGGWTEIGVRVSERVRMLARATWIIAASAGILLAALAALAWAITTRATAELARLAGELETVEAGSLDQRLAARRTSEVDRLAAVLNRLLARLEAAVGHLRRFTADAAHELRTPIAALRARLEVALAGTRSADAYRDGLLDALEQTERLGRLAGDLLTLSAVESGVPRGEVVRLDAVAREVAEFLDPVAQEQGRRFVCEAEESVSVRGTPDLLKRLVLNLVDNAFRHTASAAAVRLSVGARDGTAALEVRDEGEGIPEAEARGLFERFRRGPTAAPGAGLGLALCREIATRHGGDIQLHSAPGEGTTITVRLPLAASGGAS